MKIAFFMKMKMKGRGNYSTGGVKLWDLWFVEAKQIFNGIGIYFEHNVYEICVTGGNESLKMDRF